MTYVPITDAAKVARSDLKRAFPGTKFSVRCEHYTSINVRYTDGPIAAAVKEVVRKHESIDRGERTGEILSGGNRFVFVNREYTKAADLWGRIQRRQKWGPWKSPRPNLTKPIHDYDWDRKLHEIMQETDFREIDLPAPQKTAKQTMAEKVKARFRRGVPTEFLKRGNRYYYWAYGRNLPVSKDIVEHLVARGSSIVKVA